MKTNNQYVTRELYTDITKAYELMPEYKTEKVQAKTAGMIKNLCQVYLRTPESHMNFERIAQVENIDRLLDEHYLNGE